MHAADGSAAACTPQQSCQNQHQVRGVCTGNAAQRTEEHVIHQELSDHHHHPYPTLQGLHASQQQMIQAEAQPPHQTPQYTLHPTPQFPQNSIPGHSQQHQQLNFQSHTEQHPHHHPQTLPLAPAMHVAHAGAHNSSLWQQPPNVPLIVSMMLPSVVNDVHVWRQSAMPSPPPTPSSQ